MSQDMETFNNTQRRLRAKKLFLPCCTTFERPVALYKVIQSRVVHHERVSLFRTCMCSHFVWSPRCLSFCDVISTAITYSCKPDSFWKLKTKVYPFHMPQFSYYTSLALYPSPMKPKQTDYRTTTGRLQTGTKHIYYCLRSVWCLSVCDWYCFLRLERINPFFNIQSPDLGFVITNRRTYEVGVGSGDPLPIKKKMNYRYLKDKSTPKITYFQ